MKFKGHILKLNGQEFTLKEQLSQGGFSLIYSTNKSEAVCKLQMISQSNIAYAYNNQKNALTNLQHKNIVKCYGSKQQKIGDNNVGLMILENCSRGNAFDILEKAPGNVPQPTVLRVMQAVASALEYMHAKGYSHRDIKLENVLINSNNEFKLCDFGSSTKEVIETIDNNNRADIEDHIEKTTTPIYRSPQQLDMYSGFPIGSKVDVFALGVLGFIMCFKKQPFQTRLSAINNQYFLPDEHIYSSQFIKILQDCFICDPRCRPSAKTIKQRITALIKRKKAHIQINFGKQINQIGIQFQHIKPHSFKQTSVAQAGFLSKFKRMYSQMTTQTQGWIVGFIQDSQEAPNLKFNRSIISKCWEKRYKVAKFYAILWKSSEQYKNKCLVTLKLLTLLHNFLRKGPKQAVTYDDKDCAIKLCQKIYMHWKCAQKPTDAQDIKRNSFVILLIRMYCLVIIGKSKLCYENSSLIEGNYSILPFFTSKQQQTLLKLSFIKQLLNYLEICTVFHQQLQKNSYLIDIQRTIILSIVDEQYCLVSTLIFIYNAFKHAIHHQGQQLDFVKLEQHIKQIQSRFHKVYNKLINLFKMNKKLASLFQNNQFQLNPKVVDHLEKIPLKVEDSKQYQCQQFKINKYLNYKITLHGFKIPLTYEEVVKNPDFLKDIQKHHTKSKQYIQINQFKAHKKSNYQKDFSEPKNDGTQVSNNLKMYETPKFQNHPKSTQQQSKYNKKNIQSNFSSFTLQIDPTHNPNNTVISNADRQLFNTMQFTHQNLNMDFQSVEVEKTKPQIKQKKDKFADFMSIVEQKYQDDKKLIKQKQNQHKKINAQIIEQNKASTQKQQHQGIKSPKSAQKQGTIKKIQLINFFDDQSSQQTPATNTQEKLVQNPVKQQSIKQILDIKLNASQMKNVKKDNNDQIVTIPNLQKQQKDLQRQKKLVQQQMMSINQMGYLSGSKKVEKHQKKQQRKPSKSKEKTHKIKKQQERIQKQKKQMVSKIKEVNIVEECTGFSKTSESFIDLKQFIVEEVKKNAQQYFIDYGALRFKKKIGFGHSSEVYKGQWRGRQVAIKKIKDDISTPSAQKQFRRQIMTSVRIRHHPQLVTLIGVAQHDNFYYIINQYCQGATLFDILHESKVPLSWKTRISIARQIASGMLFLHTNQPPIIHRDLKSLNVLLVNKYSDKHPDSMQIKIADFGLSRDFASTYMTGTLGTYHWMAPQIFNNQPYTLRADVYSFAIVLWEIAARKPPYLNMKNPQALMKFVTLQNGRPNLRDMPEDCPKQLITLMKYCWDSEPNNRPDFQQILDALKKIEFF